MSLIEPLIVGVIVFVICLFVVGPLVRRQRRDNGRTPKVLWLIVAIAAAAAVGLAVYSLTRPR
jgi:multisubunit Na+/H+ antiporter MnhB subunit